MNRNWRNVKKLCGERTLKGELCCLPGSYGGLCWLHNPDIRMKWGDRHVRSIRHAQHRRRRWGPGRMDIHGVTSVEAKALRDLGVIDALEAA